MTLTWYFDFISPFAYLQHVKFAELPADVTVEYRPILLAGLLNHWQNVGPAEIPPKRIFTYQYCYWLARRDKVAFKMPPAHPFNSLSALRLAIAMGCDANSIQSIFDIIWKEGLAIDSREAQQKLSLLLRRSDLSSLCDDPQVKLQLRANTELAARQGVFGVPSFVTQEEAPQLFWGLDAWDMLCDYLRDPVAFNDDEMRRIPSTPVGIQRKRE